MPDPAEEKSAISTANNQNTIDIDVDTVERLAAYILTEEDLDELGQLSITFVDIEEMTRLNGVYRKHEGPTDVLSFSLKSDDADEFVTPVPLLGNVIICPEIAARNATEDGIETEDEIELLVAHGILHLLGYSHNNEARERTMNRRQSELVSGFNNGDKQE